MWLAFPGKTDYLYVVFWDEDYRDSVSLCLVFPAKSQMAGLSLIKQLL